MTDAIGVTLGVHVLKLFAFAYDVLTFPIYVLLQQPWKHQSKSWHTKTNIVSSNSTSITYRSALEPGPEHVAILRNHVDTMTKMFEYACKVHSHRKCLGTRQVLGEEDELQSDGQVLKKLVLGEYKWKTYAEVNALAQQFGRGLVEIIGTTDRSNVAIFAETREEWMIAAQALFKHNIPLVTIYATLGEQAIVHGLNETEVKTVITSYDLLPRLLKILHQIPQVQTIIYMEDQLKALESNMENNTNVRIIKYSQVIELGVNSRIVASPPTPNDTAIIMYTSGSTGTPKGVIKQHRNLLATVKAFCDSRLLNHDDTVMGLLPLAHTYELLAESACLLIGTRIGYASALTIIDTSSKIRLGSKGDATVLRPTVLNCVPLILNRISNNIQDKVQKAGLLKRILFKFACDYKVAWTRRGIAYRTPLIDRLVFVQSSRLLGGRMRILISGGAPLSADVHELINACLCTRIVQGYGLTETTSCATLQNYYDIKFGCVGAPASICDVKLINWEEGNYCVTDKPYARGEVVVGGDNVSAGYFKMPDMTREYFFDENGKHWFKTGDIGEFNDNGEFRLIDRKKDLVKLQAGEYVSLSKVETQLRSCLWVDNICVYADPLRTNPVALVIPNQSNLFELAGLHGLATESFEELCRSEKLQRIATEALIEHGKKRNLAKFELPSAIRVLPDQWTPDSGLVTASMKLKRRELAERYQQEIAQMYQI